MKEARQIAILAGGSHLMCLGAPLKSEDGRPALMPLNGTDGDFLYLTGAFPRDERFWMELERLAPDYKLFISWRGNQHMAEHLFASNPPFDFVLSDQSGLPIAKDSVIVPEQMLREKFAPSLDRLEVLLKNVANVASQGVFVCGTPPPKEDTAVTRASLVREQYLIDHVAALGSSVESIALTPPETLYKMWRLIQNMLRDLADKHGVRFVPVPAEAQTPSGFLRREFWSSDVTHANSDFGRLFLQHLREYL